MTYTATELAQMLAANAEIWEHALDPQPWVDPVREAWADHWAEQRADERRWERAQAQARREDRAW